MDRGPSSRSHDRSLPRKKNSYLRYRNCYCRPSLENDEFLLPNGRKSATCNPMDNQLCFQQCRCPCYLCCKINLLHGLQLHAHCLSFLTGTAWYIFEQYLLWSWEYKLCHWKIALRSIRMFYNGLEWTLAWVCSIINDVSLVSIDLIRNSAVSKGEEIFDDLRVADENAPPLRETIMRITNSDWNIWHWNFLFHNSAINYNIINFWLICDC